MISGDGFSIESNDAAHCVAVVLFLADFKTFDSFGDNPVVRVCFKFWNSFLGMGGTLGPSFHSVSGAHGLVGCHAKICS